MDSSETSRRSTKVDASSTVEEYINKEDWRINANANTGYSHAGLVNNLAGKLIANYWLDEVYSKEEGAAHRNGDYHIHDLDNLSPYCLTKDTKILTLEYAAISIESIIKKNLGVFEVESYDFEKHVKTLREACNVRCTRHNAELVEVEFEDGIKVRCTPDHQFYQSDGTWGDAQYLRPGVPVWTIYNTPKKVKSVTPLKEREDVYCMYVPTSHCFALENGVISHNCCGHDFQKLLDEGFNGVVGRPNSKAPKHFREALYQLANYFGILQAEWAGAQAVSSFDTYLAPYVFFDMRVNGLQYDDIKKSMRNFVYNLNVPSRWGQCVPTSYRCLRGDGTWVYYSALKEGDEIYVFDTKTGKIKKDRITHLNKFQSPAHLHEYYDEEGFSFSVTPNHRVIYRQNDVFEIKESQELLEAGKEVEIPISRADYISADELRADSYDISDDELELFTIFLVQDGIIDPYYHTVKCKLNSYCSHRVERICKKLDIQYRKTVYGDIINYEFNQIDPCITKIFNLLNENAQRYDFQGRLSIKQAHIILDTWLCLEEDNGNPSWCINTLSYHAKMLAYLAVMAGNAVQLLTNGEDNLIESIAIGQGETKLCKIREVSSTYKEVWCPTTDTGTFICMADNGCIFITGNSPFTNITIDWTVPNLLKDMAPIRNGQNYFKSIIDEWHDQEDKQERAHKLIEIVCERFETLDKETYSTIKEDVNAVLLSFSYRFLQHEMNIINKAFYEILNEGDTIGQPFTFPIPTINITEDFDWEGENTDLLFENTAKYGSSYFQNFIGSQYMLDENGNKVHDPNAYSPNDVRSMCPLALDTKVITNNGVKMIAALEEGIDKVFYNNAWFAFRRVTNIMTQDCYLVVLDGKTSTGAPMSFKAGGDHRQPVFDYRTREYQIKPVRNLTQNDFIPVEVVYDPVERREIIPQPIRFTVGDDRIQYVAVKQIIQITPQKLMCIEVANRDHLFTLANCIITSNCRLQLDKRQLRKKGGGLFGSDSKTGCYDDQTEVLTKDGWKYFKDVTPDDEFYTLNEKREIELHKPSFIISKPYNGDMYHFTNRTLDLMVTPKHRMPLVDIQQDKIYWKTAEECIAPFHLPIHGEWKAQQAPQYYILKGAKSNHKTYENIKIDYKIWCAFLGLFISEGYASGTKSIDLQKVLKYGLYAVGITQKKIDNISFIDSIMEKMPFLVHRSQMKDGTIKWVIYNKSLWEECYKFGNSLEKHIPRYIFSLPKDYLQILFDALILGDGCRNKKHPHCVKYYTSSKQLKDDMQQLCLLLGHTTRIGVRKHAKSATYIRGRIVKPKNINYEIQIHYAYNRAFTGEASIVHYKGNIYCVTVPNHIICVRRGGSVIWCGNSIGVVTLNCARLGYSCKGSEKKLYQRLDKLCDLAKSTLEKKRAVVTELLQRGLYPYTRRYIGSFDTYFSTIGVNGINEMIRNFTNDTHNITDQFGQQFASDFLEHIRTKLIEYQEETGNLYNMEAAPAEGCVFQDSCIWTNKGFKKIKDLVGQSNVYAFTLNEQTNKIELKLVESVYQTSAKAIVMKITFDNGREIICTLNHPIAKKISSNKNQYYEWKEATNLQIGDCIISNQSIKDSWSIVKIEYLDKEIPVYNLTVKDNHNYYVSDSEDAEDAILMHNCMRRFAHLDKKKYPDILQAGFSDSIPYYTNSSQLPVEFTADPFTALDLQDNLQKKYTGGCVSKGNYIITNQGWIKIEDFVKKFKKLDEIQVMAFDPATGKVVWDKVIDAVQIDVAKHDKIKVSWIVESIVYTAQHGISDDVGGSIITSDWHPFFRRKNNKIEEVRADDLKEGDIIIGTDPGWTIPLNRVVTAVSKVDVDDNQFYDLTTEKYHNYLAGTSSFVFVHNTVLHLYMRERISSAEICKKLVRTVLTNYRLPYISITPTFSTCPIHGRLEGEHEFCPKCDAELVAKHAQEIDSGL